MAEVGGSEAGNGTASDWRMASTSGTSMAGETVVSLAFCCWIARHYVEDRNMPREESWPPDWTQQARIGPSVQLNLFE
jgi:hypothetical protein